MYKEDFEEGDLIEVSQDGVMRWSRVFIAFSKEKAICVGQWSETLRKGQKEGRCADVWKHFRRANKNRGEISVLISRLRDLGAIKDGMIVIQ